MKVVALAGGVGAGRFLRGLVRVIDPSDLTVIVNTADDITVHGLHVSPDVDSVIYALAGLADRERGWGRAGESFRATEELRERFGASDAWFNLGDRDLATHLRRSALLASGSGLAAATAQIASACGLSAAIVPMSEDPVTTLITVEGPDGAPDEQHFQEYWVRDHAQRPVRSIRFDGADRSAPTEGVLAAIASADVLVICPSNPVVSIAPIFAVPGIREAVSHRRPVCVGISPIIGGAPVRGMADKLMPAAGLEVSALGAAAAYQDVLASWVIDERDRALAPDIESQLGVRVGVTQTLMDDHDDTPAERLAAFALDHVAASGRSA